MPGTSCISRPGRAGRRRYRVPAGHAQSQPPTRAECIGTRLSRGGHDGNCDLQPQAQSLAHGGDPSPPTTRAEHGGPAGVSPRPAAAGQIGSAHLPGRYLGEAHLRRAGCASTWAGPSLNDGAAMAAEQAMLPAAATPPGGCPLGNPARSSWGGATRAPTCALFNQVPLRISIFQSRSLAARQRFLLQRSKEPQGVSLSAAPGQGHPDLRSGTLPCPHRRPLPF